MMDMSQGMHLLPQMGMKASPALIALNAMLVLPSQELQQLVEQELAENPALEQIDRDEAVCPRCGRPLSGMACVYCLHDDLQLAEAERGSSVGLVADEEFDPLLLVAAPSSLPEMLVRDLHVALPSEDHPIADYLVGMLTPQGFLDGTVEDAADALGASPERVERALKLLQEFGPAGVGARNVQECLLIHLDRLAPDLVAPPHLRAIIEQHWNDLGEHRYGAIAQALGMSYDDVVDARDFLRDHLRPYPLSQGQGNESETNYLTPDVIIREDADGFVVEVVESNRFFLRLSPLYQQLAKASARSSEPMSDEDREHLTQFVARAQMFLTNLRQRRETIRRITECIIERQEAFLRSGVRSLAPLTRAEVAASMGVHESTVSRATASKYAQLPSYKVVPFSTFFTASLSIKDVIHELVHNETVPLTDQDLVEMLKARGFDVARRTIAKYRGQLGILPSTLR